MKNSPFRILIICLLCFTAHLSQAQVRRTITLKVNTTEITRKSVNENCSFGQPSRISNEDYTIEVKLGDTVVWNGISTSSEDDRVEIVSINHEGGARLFNRNVLRGSRGVVSAEVATGKSGDSEKYTIKFIVYRNGEKIPGTFKIDPKLTVKQ